MIKTGGVISEKKYVLIPNLDELGMNKMYISRFLKSIWNHPEIAYKALVNASKEDVKNILSSFIVNNIYCNHLSGNYIENNLLYVITLMLKDEIDKLTDVNKVDQFLEDTKCGYLLEQLQKMPDIQIYFNKVILKTIEKIERKCSSRVININVDERNNEFSNLLKNEEKKCGKKNKVNRNEVIYKILYSKVNDQSINNSMEENSKKCEKLNKIFMEKYAPNIKIVDFEKFSQKAQTENKANLFDYFNRIKEEISIKNNEDKYSNITLMNKLYQYEYPQEILNIYQNDFLEIVSFIDQLIFDLMENIRLLPNTIKYICKIISLLIRDKFKNITKIDEFAFISKFIIGKLLKQIIKSPCTKALISDFVISGNTIENLNIISKIMDKLFSMKLFLNKPEEGDFTPFNWYFFDKVEDILSFLEKTVNVNLPLFIEQFAKNELTKDYKYDFFTVNKEEIYANISICFNLNHLFCLINGLKNEKDLELLNYLGKSFNKLCSKETCEGIKSTNEDLKKKHREKLLNKHNKEYDVEIYYIYNDKEIEEKYKLLFNINNNFSAFNINIKKKEKENGKENEKFQTIDEDKINIIKVKNYLYNALANFRLLNKSDFNIGETSDTKRMLNEIKSYMSFPNFILSNNTIPSTWYINSILDYLEKIPEDYKENDYKKLFEEITKNINDFINKLNFEILIMLRNKIRFIDKMLNYYENVKDSINSIDINEKIKRITEKSFIPIDINFKYDDKEKKFELKKSNIKEKQFEDKIIYEDLKRKTISVKTIEAFTRYFPNLSKYQILQGANPIDIIKELSINEQINNYFELIKKELQKVSETKDKFKEYSERIEDYIMNKIYDKIYPPEIDEMDNQIYQKTIQLSWVEPNMLMKKDYIYDNMLPDILNEFRKIHISTTPHQKLNCIKKIILYIANLIRFNEGMDVEIGADNISPILNYALIKAHPFKLFTDLEFIKIFSESNGQSDNNIANIEGMYKIVIESKCDSYHLTPEEFIKRCNESTKEIKNN